MDSPTLEQTEAYSAARATHPRVTLDSMKAKIISEDYFTVGEAIRLAGGNPHPSLDILTLCILVTETGFTIVGKSAPASPENFDREKGRRFAYEDAIKQLWPLEGYLLRSRLADEAH